MQKFNMHIALKAIHLLNNYTKTDKTVMTKTFKINEEIIFYNNTIDHTELTYIGQLSTNDLERLIQQLDPN